MITRNIKSKPQLSQPISCEEKPTFKLLKQLKEVTANRLFNVKPNRCRKPAKEVLCVHRLKLFFRAALATLSLGACIALVCYLQNFTLALDVSYNQRELGCVKSQNELKLATKIVENKVICQSPEEKPSIKPAVTPKLVKTSEVLNEDEMAQEIIEKSDDLVEAQGLYVDGNFVGAVENHTELVTAMDTVLESHKTGAQNEQVDFADKIEVVSGVYMSDKVVEKEKLVDIISAEKPIPVETKHVETTIEEVPFETEIIESDEYALGTEKTVTAGAVGEKVKRYSVLLLDNVQQSKTLISESITKPQVNEQILRGTADVITAMSAENPSDAGFIWPIISPVISSEFGYRWGTNHNGLDICAGDGDTYGEPIYAAAGGTVSEVLSTYESGGYGNLIILDHGNGVQTYYAHTDSIIAAVGQVVRQGEVVAYAGSSGDSTGAHLHFEVRTNGLPQNPINYLG